MPYQGLNTSISMYIFLPINASDSPRRYVMFKSNKTETKISIDQFLEKLTPEILDEVFDEGFQRELMHEIRNKIYVEIPKISFDHGFSLSSVIIITNIFFYIGKKSMRSTNILCFFKTLAHMGIGALSSEEFAEKQSLKFETLHQAKIEIDESGTVAAPATAMLDVMSGSNLRFICNRPFMFLILNKISKEILFAGIYRGPNK